MTLNKLILFGFLLLPAAEIAGFLARATLIGGWAALGALLAFSLLSAVNLRRAAATQIDEFGRQVEGSPVKILNINASGLCGPPRRNPAAGSGLHHGRARPPATGDARALVQQAIRPDRQPRRRARTATLLR